MIILEVWKMSKDLVRLKKPQEHDSRCRNNIKTNVKDPKIQVTHFNNTDGVQEHKNRLLP